MSKNSFLAKYGSPEDLTNAMIYGSRETRQSVFLNPMHTSAHVDQGLRDDSDAVNEFAAASPHATREQLERALRHPSGYVRIAAEENLKRFDES